MFNPSYSIKWIGSGESILINDDSFISAGVLASKFFYCFMKTADLTALDMGVERPSLTQEIFNEIKIPIPPLETQAKIVAILDKFDSLTHSITEGFPKEIELREKQYQYYREKLLGFSK